MGYPLLPEDVLEDKICRALNIQPDLAVSVDINLPYNADSYDLIAKVEALQERWQNPNIYYRLPATPAGLSALEALSSRGVKTEVRAIYDVVVYRATLEAYIAGLKRYASQNGNLAEVASGGKRQLHAHPLRGLPHRPGHPVGHEHPHLPPVPEPGQQ